MNPTHACHRPFLPFVLALALALTLPFGALADVPAEDTENAPTSEERLNNTLRWSTASEVDNFGYDVYRGESEEGPFDRITEKPIQGAGTTDDSSAYVYVDDTIDPSMDYYYYVESISLSGERERFTPIFKAKAKLPADGDQEEGDEAEGEQAQG